MPTARERLVILNRQIEYARLAVDERRSLLRLMEEQGENTEHTRRLLVPLLQSLEDMIQFRTEVLRKLEQSGG